MKNYIKANGFCNKEHRLMKFLEKNSQFLEDKVPGLWNKILRVLVQEDGKTLIQEVNLILNDLRKIADLEVHVPDCLFLSEDDLLKADRFTENL